MTAVSYQHVDVRSFFDANGDGWGDLPGLIAKLDYLQDLGVGALRLINVMPTDFAYGGTMITDYFSVESRLGTLTDFDRLIAEAHRRGIRVVTGYSPYTRHPDHPHWHASRDPEHPQHAEFADFFFWGSDDANEPSPARMGRWEWDPLRQRHYYTIWFTWDGRPCPETNATSPRLRRENEAILRFWLDRGVDGFWVDTATAGTFMRPADHVAFSREFNAIVHSYPERRTLAEGGTRSVAATIEEDGFDSFWTFQARKLPLYETVFGPPGRGLLAEGPSGQEWHGLHEALIGWYDTPGGNQATHLYLFPQALDLEDPSVAARAKQLHALAATLPLAPEVRMGGELGLTLVQHTAGAGSRFHHRPMPWQPLARAPHYGFTTGAPWMEVGPCPDHATIEAQLAKPDSILSAYRAVTRLRRDTPALQAHWRISQTYAMVPSDDRRETYGFLRRNPEIGQLMFAAFNFGHTPRVATFDFGRSARVREFLASQPTEASVRYRLQAHAGAASTQELAGSTLRLPLPAHGFAIFELLPLAGVANLMHPAERP
jgi:alpha-glucosidase